MDKPGNVYVPAPSMKSDNQQVSGSVPDAQGVDWRMAEKASFEKALEQIRNREQAAFAAVKTVGQNDHNSHNAAPGFKCHSDETLPGEAVSYGDILTDNSDTTDQFQSLKQTQHQNENITGSAPSRNDEIELTENHRVEQPPTLSQDSLAGLVSASSAIEPAVPNLTATLNTGGGSSLAETVASLMKQIAYSEDPISGSWQFDVVDEATGLAGMQLRRSAGGSWDINIALSRFQNDEQWQADELLASLKNEGHDVESVTFSPDTFE